MAQRIVVIGGGAAGIGAAGAAKGTDPSADVRVYTEFEDVGYSPCGIPYVHGRKIPDFERLFLATRETYANAGIDIHYETRVTGFSAERKTVPAPGGRGLLVAGVCPRLSGGALAGTLRADAADAGQSPHDLD
ncbi:MAG: hypothetical protein ACRDOH_01330 [Streptosporangiaceae bacterium]